MLLRILSGKGAVQIMPFWKLSRKFHFFLRFCTRKRSKTIINSCTSRSHVVPESLITVFLHDLQIQTISFKTFFIELISEREPRPLFKMVFFYKKKRYSHIGVGIEMIPDQYAAAFNLLIVFFHKFA